MTVCCAAVLAFGLAACGGGGGGGDGGLMDMPADDRRRRYRRCSRRHRSHLHAGLTSQACGGPPARRSLRSSRHDDDATVGDLKFGPNRPLTAALRPRLPDANSRPSAEEHDGSTGLVDECHDRPLTDITDESTLRGGRCGPGCHRCGTGVARRWMPRTCPPTAYDDPPDDRIDADSNSSFSPNEMAATATAKTKRTAGIESGGHRRGGHADGPTPVSVAAWRTNDDYAPIR